jgi:hypothetical protein
LPFIFYTNHDLHRSTSSWPEVRSLWSDPPVCHVKSSNRACIALSKMYCADITCTVPCANSETDPKSVGFSWLDCPEITPRVRTVGNGSTLLFYIRKILLISLELAICKCPRSSSCKNEFQCRMKTCSKKQSGLVLVMPRQYPKLLMRFLCYAG